ncbi:MAG: hypothetical protein HQ502_00600 [Alphaproteobacteria bacterium]|nr:hypothetical protein [Alphaproteobacteria bacterium]
MIPGAGGAVTGADSILFSMVRNQIICIDDLERRGEKLEIKDVLGLMSFLKEERGCKVILILDKNNLGEEGEKELNKYFEKVIDSYLQFAPEPEDSARIVFPNNDGNDVAAIKIAENCKILRISNIRVIKKIERLVRKVEPLVATHDKAIFHQAVHSLTLLAWIKYQPGMAPSLDYLKARYGIGGDDADEKAIIAAEGPTWNATIDAYGFYAFDEFDLVLQEGIENGFFDPIKIEKHGSELENTIGLQGRDNDYRLAWDIYHDSFDNNADEVLDKMYAAFKNNIRKISPTNLNGTISLFKELGREQQAKELIKFYVEGYGQGPDFWSLKNYPFAADVIDPDVVAAFDHKYKSFGKEEINPSAMLLEIGAQNGWGARDLPALASLEPNEYYKIFKSHRGQELSDIVSAALKFESIGNASDEMKEISKRAREALIVIGKESPINARRLHKKYGIEIEN